MSLSVLLFDNHLLAVEKPACLPSVPDASGDESLLDRARSFVERELAKPGRAYLGVVHRLDRPVSGVVLFARTSKAAERLTAQFRERRTEKTYLGVVEGAPPGDEGLVDHWLAKDRGQNRVRVLAGPGAGERPGAKRAVTRWRVLRREGGRALVELAPETGRPHQLRVALASLGCPLLGDLKYGAAAPLDDKSIALHAARLVVLHPTKREPVELACPPPAAPWWALAR